MASLTTIYGTGAAIGTVAAFVAAYVGHSVYPIQTGGNLSEVVNTITETVKSVGETIITPPEQPLNTEVTPLEPPVEEQSLPQVELPPAEEQLSST